MEQFHFHFLRPRNLLVFIFSFSLVALILLREPLFLFLVVTCLAAVLLSLKEATGLLSHIKINRTHHPRVFQDNRLNVKVLIEGTENRAPELLLVEDYFSPATVSKIRRLIESPLKKGKVVEFHYQGMCSHRRGLYTIGPVRLQAFDSFGFFSRELYVEEFTDLLVYPQAVDLQQNNLLGEGTLFHVGLESHPKTGYSEEFQGIREYQQGDSPRLIHWKSTARHNQFMVKEFIDVYTTEVIFFLDLGRLGLVGIGDQTSVEYGIKCCASLSKRAVERGHAVGLCAIGKKVEYLPPRTGVSHLLAILDRLAFVKPEGDTAFVQTVTDMAREIPRGSTAVLLMGATTIDLDPTAVLIQHFIDRRILPVMILIDDRAFIKIFREQEDRHFEALSLDEIATKLKMMGAQVHVVGRASSMTEALTQGLEREYTL